VSIVLGLLSGCEPAPQPAVDDRTHGGTLVIAGPGDLDHANPLVTADAYTQEVNRFLLFTPLVRYAADLTIEPYLAESWTMDGDTALTFALRRDVMWHDGVRTTAEDVRFTIATAMNPAAAYPNAAYFSDWQGVEVIDSFTVRASFRPHADPLSAVALLPIAPAHLLASVAPEELRTATFNRAPVGNGPFRFVSQQASDRWVFAANTDFPAGLGGRPYVDRVVWRVIPDRQAQVTELLTDNADLVLIPPAEAFDDLAARPGVNGLVRPSFKYTFVGWNGQRAPFGDARVRRALTLAIDRAEIIQTLRAGEGDLAAGPIHPNHWAFDRSLEPLPFDTATARTLLAEAGILDRNGDSRLEHPDGREFAFDLEFQANSDFNRSMVEMIQADLGAIGVTARPRPLDWSTLVAHVSSPEREFDAVLMGWEADFRVDLRDLFHSAMLDGPFQLASYDNPPVDSLLDRAGKIVNREESMPVWHQLQRILRDEQPWTFLYYYPDLMLSSERLHGADMDLRGILATVTRWTLAAGN
jgi:peptide/nickel transport system substrate-binding protein